MAVKYTRRYTNEAEYILDVAKGSEYFRTDTYNVLDPERAVDYSYAVAGTKNKKSNTFNVNDYDMLGAEDKYTYLMYHYYADDKNSIDNQKTKDYLDYQLENARNQMTYESLNGFEKTTNSVGGILANAVNGLFLGTIEGLIDAVGTLVGAKDFVDKDITGYRAMSEELSKFNAAYTNLDKNGVWRVANDVVSGLTKMAPLLLNVPAPGLGSAIYFSGMAGNSAEETILSNPDIDYLSLIGYVGATTGLEFATEKLSGVFLGRGTVIDNLFAKTAGKPGGSWVKRIGLDFLSEGLEESVSEFGGEVLKSLIVNKEQPFAEFNMKDILYAGLIGGLIGGVSAVGKVATTSKNVVLKDGRVVTMEEYKKSGAKDGKILSKIESLNLMEAIAEAQEAINNTAESKLIRKYASRGESINQIKTNHAEEYKAAIEKDQSQQDKLVKAALDLTRVYQIAGAEQFKKSMKLAEYTVEQKQKLINNYKEAITKATGLTEAQKAVSKNFQFKTGYTIDFKNDLNVAEKAIQNTLKNEYGMNVYFGHLGKLDGENTYYAATLDEKTIILDADLTNTMSVESILDQVVKEELVHALQFASGILNKRNMQELNRVYEQTKPGTLRLYETDLDAAYAKDSDVTKMSERQAKAMAQVLLFDELTVSKLFMTNRNIVAKVYRWLKDMRDKTKNGGLKNRKDKLKYNTILKSMRKHQNAVAARVGNAEDVDRISELYGLDANETQYIRDAYQANVLNEHFTITKIQLSQDSLQMHDAQKALLDNSNPGFKTLRQRITDPANFVKTIFDSTTYTTEFVEKVMSLDPSKDFKYNLQTYLINNFNVSINERLGVITETVDLTGVANDKFKKMLTENPEALEEEFYSLYEVFDETFTDKFENEDGTNSLEDVALDFVVTDEKSPVKATYDATENVITVNISKSNPNPEEIAHALFHEASHAISNLNNLPNGTSTIAVKRGLQTLQPNQIDFLAGKLLTKEFYERNKNNPQLLHDYLAYAIYRITDGEYSAEAYSTSKVREGEPVTHLKAGYNLNQSGFTAIGNKIYGYGVFKDITLDTTKTVENMRTTSAIVRAVQGLRKAYDVVSYYKTKANIKELTPFLMEKGLLNKPGVFSSEFETMFIEGRLNRTELWELVSQNKVGNEEATNAVIEWLTEGKNTSMRTIKNVEDANPLGISYAVMFSEIAKKADAKIDPKKPRTYEQIQEFIISNKINEKFVDRWMERIEVLLRNPENTQIRKWLLVNDFDYSINKTKQLYKTLAGHGINSELREVSAEKKTTAKDGEMEGNLADIVQDDSNTTEDEGGEPDVYGDQNALMAKLDKDIFEEEKEVKEDTINPKKSFDEWINDLEAMFSSPRGFTSRNNLSREEYKKQIIKQFGEKGYDRLLAAAPKSKDYYKDHVKKRIEKIEQEQKSLTPAQKKVLDTKWEDFTTPLEYETYLTKLDKILLPKAQRDGFMVEITELRQELNSKKLNARDKSVVERDISDYWTPSMFKEYIDRLKNIKDKIVSRETKKTQAPVVTEEVVTTPTEVETEPIVEPAKIENEPPAKEITPESEEIDIKKAKEQKKKISVDQKIIDKGDLLISLIGRKIASQYQGDFDNPEYKKASKNIIDNNKQFFESLTSDDLQGMLKYLRIVDDFMAGDAAYNLLMRYAYDHRGSPQFKDISEFIKLQYKRQATFSAQFMGGLSATYGHHHITKLLSSLASEKGDLQIPDEILRKLVAKYNKTHAKETVNSKITQLKEQIKSLENQLDKERTERRKEAYERALSSLNNEKIADLEAEIDRLNTELKEAKDNNLKKDLAEDIEMLSSIKDKISFKNVDTLIKSFENEVSDLGKKLEATEDPWDRAQIEQELNYKQDIIDAIRDGDYAEAADLMSTYIQDTVENQAENEETITSLYQAVIDWVITQPDVAKIPGLNATKTQFLSDEAKKKLTNTLQTITSIRYLAMLSSPLTAGRNALSNTGIAAVNVLETAGAKWLENRKWLDRPSQVRLTGSYDAAFSAHIDELFGERFKSLLSGTKYNETERTKLKEMYAKEQDAVEKNKILKKIRDIENKMLSDTPWTYPKTMKILKNSLAGSRAVILSDCLDTLYAMYMKDTPFKDRTTAGLISKITSNPEMRSLVEKAVDGDLIATVDLAMKLKLSIVDINDKTSIPHYAAFNANELFLKTSNWASKVQSSLIRNHPGAAFLISHIVPFARVAVNSAGYIVHRSPIGLAKGIIHSLQARNVYLADMKESIVDYYKDIYTQSLPPKKAYKNDEFVKWYGENVPQEVQTAVEKGGKQIKEVYDRMTDEGKTNPLRIGADNRFLRAEAFKEVSQGVVGTSLMVLGCIIAAATDAFEYDDDDDYLGPVIRIGDLKIAVEDLSPFSTMFSLGAVLASGKIDNKLDTIFNVVSDATFLGILDSAFKYNDSLKSYFENQFINSLSQYIPALTKYIRKPFANKKDKSGSFGEKLLKTLASNTMLFGWLVPNKINPYTGEPEKYYESGLAESILGGLISPIGVRVDAKSQLQREAESVKTTTKGLTGKFTINGDDIVVTGKDKEKLAKYKAEYVKTEFDKISSGSQKVTVEDANGKRITTTYDKLTSEQKSKVLKNLYSKATEVAKIKYWTDSGNYYVVTDRTMYNEYAQMFEQSQLLYKTEWSKSKFVEG